MPLVGSYGTPQATPAALTSLTTAPIGPDGKPAVYSIPNRSAVPVSPTSIIAGRQIGAAAGQVAKLQPLVSGVPTQTNLGGAGGATAQIPAQADYNSRIQAYAQQQAQALAEQQRQFVTEEQQAADAATQATTAYQQLLAQRKSQDAYIASHPGARISVVTDQQLADAQQKANIAQGHVQLLKQDHQTKLQQQSQQNDAFVKHAQDTLKEIQQDEQAQAGIDDHNKQAAQDYEKQVAQYNQLVAANQKYQQDHAAWAAQKAQLDSDIASGKYSVNPYAYIQSGASLQDILAMREQLNQGIARPLMNVPQLPPEPQPPPPVPAAPPKADIIPNLSPGNYDPQVVSILGYKAPQPTVAPNLTAASTWDPNSVATAKAAEVPDVAPPTTGGTDTTKQPIPAPASTAPMYTPQASPPAASPAPTANPVPPASSGGGQGGGQGGSQQSVTPQTSQQSVTPQTTQQKSQSAPQPTKTTSQPSVAVSNQTSAPTTQTTQMTSSQAAKTQTGQATQQSAQGSTAQQSTPTTLPTQTAGTVSTQPSNSGQQPNTNNTNTSLTQPQPTPQALTNPTPFKPTPDDNNSIWSSS